ncbi:MAG: non-ribosomal peptide synthase/polyketide synthase, partial [Acidobacteriota bacterium]
TGLEGLDPERVWTGVGEGPVVEETPRNGRRRIPLPTYPFERERYWVEAGGVVEREEAAPSAFALHDRPTLFTAYVEPSTKAERTVAAIWRELLGIREIGVHDNFFELGGHSLLGTQIIARLHRAFGLSLPLEILFSHPTVAELAGLLQDAAGIVEPGIPRRPAGAVPPLSFAQERLWFLDRFEPDSAAFNVPNAIRLTGELDVERLASCLRAVAARHEMLRTAFREDAEGRPYQVIHGEVDLPLPVVDVAGADELRSRGLEEALRPFDLGRAPLLRAVLFRLGEHEHVFLVTFHHVAADGWSLGVFVREIAALYAGGALPELPVQYADFALWQRGQLAGEALEAQLRWWSGELAGAPVVLDLPGDRPRPAVRSGRGLQIPAEVPATLREPMEELARREGATFFMVLMAGFQTLLHRYAGVDDALVGTPVANRTRPELERIIGHFVNNLVLRGRLSGEPDFRGLLGRVRTAALGAYANQDLPFERLVEALNVERSFSHTPLFQVMLTLQNGPAEALELPGLAVEEVLFDPGIARYDLTLMLADGPHGLQGSLEIDTDLFDAATGERLLRHLRTLLDAAVADPDRRLSDLPLLTTAERGEVLAFGDAVEVPDLTVDRLFDLQAGRTPDAVAAIQGEVSLTYADLQSRAEAIASHLRRLGVGPEVRVGLAVERTPDLLAALLGVMKSGGAYVPLDLSHPRERLAMIVEDAKPAVILDQELLAKVGEGAPSPAKQGRDGEGSSDNLAYILFTSGSTGRPKGVQIPHRAFVNFLLSMLREPGLDASDTLFAITTLSFDIAGLELMLPLLAGGRVALATRDEAADAVLLARRLDEVGATALQATPATWRMLLDSGWEGKADLAAFCGGEALPGELAARLRPRVKSLWNLYGPTETTVWSAAGEVEEPDPALASQPVGSPIANTGLYVLDPNQEPVPPGVPGELCIGGDGLARGYVGRPELTAERFVPDPFGLPGARLYRTGDLARRRASGEIDFLGRIDHQVKVRGFRIELGEIEAALLSHPEVRGATVLALGDGVEKTLTAYVVGETPADRLRAHLRSALPEYMVPAAFVFVESFPLNTNGKVDRKALAAIQPEQETAAFVASRTPRTDTERRLAAIWSHLLGAVQVGAGDSFFDLGGHSLLGTQLLSRVRAELGVELPLRALFEAPVLADLAARVETARQADLPPIPLRPDSETGLPLSFAQERLWFLDQLDPGAAAYNVYGAVRLEGDLDVGRLIAAVQGIVRRHEVLRTTFHGSIGGVDGPVQVVHPDLDLNVPVIEAGSEDEVRRLSEEEAFRPFDLVRGPLLRFVLLRLGEREHLGLVTFHHIAADAWSMGVFLREVVALYSGEPLPALALQYADFAVWQRRWLAGEALEEQLGWWREELAGAPTVLDLPADHPRPEQPSGRAAWSPVDLSPLRGPLEELARREGSTLFMVLLAGFQALLHRYTLAEDVLVGSPVANRGRAELEPLIGHFVNNLVMRGRFEGDPSFRELLGRTRAAALGAYDHQDLPFERLVEALHVDRSAASPLFQAMLVLQNVPLGPLELPGLVLRPVDVAAQAARLDLTLTLAEDNDSRRDLRGALELSADLFDPATGERLLAHLRNLLASAAADPERRVSGLAVLDAAESRQALLWARDALRFAAGGHELSAAAHAIPPPAITISAAANLFAAAAHAVSAAEIPSAAAAHTRPRAENTFPAHAHAISRAENRVPRAENASAVSARSARTSLTPVEERLAAVWSDLLKRPGIGRSDSFFDLGGHSLLGTRLIARIRKEFGVEIPLRRLFDSPTLAGLAALVEAASAPADPGIPVLPRNVDLELSFSQERLWFLHRLDPDSAAYNMPAALRLEGTLDVPALLASLGTIVRRHETLRTAFPSVDGRPVQRITPVIEVPLAVVDLIGLPAGRREAETGRVLAEAAVQPFDLERGPVFRVLLLRSGESDGSALLNQHHISGDLWSSGILVRELAALYEGQTLPELPVQYADWSAWQRGQLATERVESQLGHWKERLAGAPRLLALPADRPRPAVLSFRGESQKEVLAARVESGIQELARRHGATPFMVLLSAFAALLSRHTGQDDLVVGTPVAGRTRAEVEGLIGFFLNSLALRMDTSGDPTFRDLLARVREVTLDGYAHQDLPFERIVDEIAPERDLSHAPVFQVLLVLQNAPFTALELPGLRLSPIDVETGSSKLDLVLNAMETGEGIAANWMFSRDLFDPTRIARLRGHFSALLDAALTDPERTLLDLPLLSEGERQQILEWNATSNDWPAEPGLPEMIEEQVRRTPDAVAVTFEGRDLTYAELWERAGRLADALGDRPDELVGISAERSLELVVGLVGILRAGAAYVPIDPGYPADRIAYMVEDSGVSVLLSAAEIADARAMSVGARFIAPRTAPDHAAYAIYTSGTTGRPKGAVNSHRAIRNRLLWMQEAYGLTPADRVLQKTPFSFDVSVWEFFWPLITGARLVVAVPGGHQDPAYLVQTIRNERITTLHFVPSMLRVFLDAPGVEAADLKRVICSGEALPADLVRRFHEILPGVELHNLYGPTEAAVDVTAWPCVEDEATIPIGRPIANTTIHLVDPALRPVPVGVAGELFIGGVQPARGYHRRPELTAERFLPDPYGETGSRMYRTGDLARWRPDGAVEYLGRIDHQVKIRGVRIELGEIEAALADHPDVGAAVVIAKDQRLVAYLVGGEKEALQAHLASRLPEAYMPSVFVFLDEMPLSPNGKVDRKALPEPEAPETREKVAPRTPLEQFLAGLWSETVGSPENTVGIHDSFFELGGNSITGAVLVNQLQRQVGEIVHVVAIFDSPTVAKMADYLTREHRDAVVRHWGRESLGEAADAVEETVPVDADAVAEFRSLIPALSPIHLETKNPPAMFVLSPPRSGSTLLRVMLGGHPKLFSPPELELLSYNSMAERKAAYPGRDSFWLEGVIRAVMEARGAGPDEAKAEVEVAEWEDWTTQRFYGWLQEQLEGRILVDKTPSYALNPSVLTRAEEAFDHPLYIHLIRHPYGMIRSFEEAKLDQLFFRHPHRFGRRTLAELIWLVSHQVVSGFLSEIPRERQHWIRFEDLVRDPETELRRLCDTFGLDYHPDMADPYKEKQARMTDGLYAEGRMLGDVKFHQHRGVDAEAATRWRELAAEYSLGEITWQAAEALGYERLPDRSLTPIVARVRQEAPPLSFAQERLWFLHRLDPGSSAYNMPGALRLEGSLDVPALAASLREIVRRHEVLRTSFPTVDDRPVQRIDPEPRIPLPLVDLADLQNPEEVARGLAFRAVQEPFDLGAGPLMRAGLLRLAPDLHVLHLTLHHSVSDGWSLGVIVRELGALYMAFAERRPSPLPELAVQYADFADWQREWLGSDRVQDELGHWKERLAGAPRLLSLPADRPRPAVLGFRGESQRERLPARLERGLQELGRRHGATPFMVLLSAFAALLSRYTGQTDLVIGSPVAGRTRAEMEGMIGFFLNTLALRVDLSGEPDFLELLKRVRRTTLDGYAHQDLPFERVVEELAPERDLSHAPLFQVLLVLQNTPMTALRLSDLTLSAVEVDTGTSKFDLVLNATETGEGLAIHWMFHRDLFDSTRIARLRGHFAALLEGAVERPGLKVLDLPLMSAAERQQILEWNDTANAWEPEPGLPGMIEEQVRRTPDAVAVSFEGEELTYAELWERAGGVAAWLGDRPDELVGISLERSLELVVGLVGILRAGAAYVPIDPGYPAERIAYMVEDSGVSVILDRQRTSTTARTARPQGSLSSFGSFAAYAIYTSGTTGRPKGAINSHHAIRNRLLWMQEAYGLAPDDRVLQKTPFSFDVSVWEFFWPLVTGARLVVAVPGGHQDPAYLVQTIREEGITTLHFVPSMLRVFLDAPGVEPAGLRRVICSGEALPADLVRRFHEILPGVELHNLYGPTEAAVDVTAWLCADGVEDKASIPIGRPIANTTIQLVDPALGLVPVGIPGELYIGGVQPARGYHNRPELTAERFIPDPFGEPGSRMYRTGDLARWRPDGAVEYLGRIDHQVKIRGVRIELGEIESALASHPDVGAAVVVAKDQRLVAYLVGGEKEALQAHLASRLPEAYMPSAFVFLDEMPLSPNGKVDRKALPEPDVVSTIRERVEPRTALERFLAGLWSEALGGVEAGIHDSFFELGGNSISGAVLINRLQREVGEIVHVVAIFDAPTVARMAAYLAREHRDAVVRLWGRESLGDSVDAAREAELVDDTAADEIRSLLPPLAPIHLEAKNPPALFVLSPPRSGSTLLRVMLGGHPKLFSPPELELLSFNTMGERKAAFPGRDTFWLEGVIRAVMEARGCGPDEAKAEVEVAEAEDWTTQRFYGWLQAQLGGRTLVDKTPSYALNPSLLARAEEAFDRPLYIHLIRHPYGMIRSFEEAKLDQLFFRHPHRFGRRELAELIWLVSHQTVSRFLAGIPKERQHWVRYEDLVRDPETELRRLCGSLGIDYHPDMADPYKEKQSRMTDGIYAEGRMLGDVKFHQHRGVEAEAAERWRGLAAEYTLGDVTWQTALALGYERERSLKPILARPHEPGAELPISFAQERLWFLDQLEPGSPLYNIRIALRISGALDTAALEASLAEVVRRHEGLRTTFSFGKDGAFQVVHEPAFRMARVDLSALPDRETELLRLGREEGGRPFDLQRGPLLRGTLVRLADDDHAALVTQHHIVSDGWSLGVLVRETALIYEAFSQGQPSPLPELPIQYADYAAWQREWLTGEVLDAQLRWWTGELAGAPEVLDLPTDRPRPPVRSSIGAVEPIALPADLSESLHLLARREGATLFMVLMAGFQALLYRYTRQEDVLVGTPVANRGRVETEGLIGFFVNTLILRGRFEAPGSFRDLLGRTRTSALGAYAHQDLPFERLVEELGVERSLSRNPLYQVVFALQNAMVGGGSMGGSLSMERILLEGTSAKTDLLLTLGEAPDGLAGGWEYSTDLFEAATIRRLTGHLRVLLEGIAAAPGLPLTELPILTEAERTLLLRDWNDTGRPVLQVCLHELFQARAAEDPEAVALRFDGGSVTYGDLDARARRLAAELIGLGVGPEVLVGIAADEGVERVVAVLAVFLAGGAYLPLDPAHPRERLSFMLEDSGVPVLLTQRHLLAQLPESGAEVVLLDDWMAGGPAPKIDNAANTARPDNLAYVIYTSGSTGTPNGVLIQHGEAARLIRLAAEHTGVDRSSRILQSVSFSFDASVLETWLALATGATLCICRREERMDGEAMAALIRREGVTTAAMTPSFLNLLPAGRVPSLQAVYVGGDSCPGEVATRWAPHLRRLLNCYGPTETAIYATTFPVSGVWRREPPIGRPNANTRTYVVDPDGLPVPAGVPGELWVGGEVLARGYLNRPALSADRFRPDPFSGVPGARVYKSGDRARWLADGNLEFLGRVDRQVKVRGLRIELGEIEAALAVQPGVREAAVSAISVLDEAGEKHLVAYVCGEASPDALKTALRESLPEYMVPTAFVMLEALPLTPTGKVDRKALAKIRPDREARDFVAPRTPAEKALAAIWRDLLNRDRVGAEDNFFDLGGHSLLATRMVSRLRDAFGVEVAIRTVFESPVLAELAARLEPSSAPAASALLPVERTGEIPLSFGQERFWFLDRLLEGSPGSAAYNIPVALRFEGALDVPALAAALLGIVRRHEILRTSYPTVAGRPVQRIAGEAVLPLPVVDLRTVPDRETVARRLLSESAARPFDLQRGPVLRARLLRLGEEDWIALLDLHHIAGDGWSVGLLMRELGTLYGGAALPDLPMQYADFAAWQRGSLALDGQLDFWKRQLAGAPGQLGLPTDRPRPAVASQRGGAQRDRLPLGRMEGATPFMVLLASFAALLSRHSGQTDLVIGTPVAGRTRAETEGLIGLFLNTLALRVDLSGDPTLAELVERVRAVTLEAYANQDLPFEKVVEALDPVRDLSRTPIFQVQLVLQNTPESGLELPGLTLTPLEVETGVSKLDLSLSATETDDGVTSQWVFSHDLFDPTRVARMRGHLSAILQADPGSRVSELPLLSEAEKHQLLEWNATSNDWPDGPCLPEMIERQVERTPDAVAVSFEGEHLTYAELWERSCRVAAWLGARPDELVGISTERSLELVVGLVGILRSGAAYVPIDPHYPAERVAFMVEDSGVSVLLDATAVRDLPVSPAPAVSVDPDALAYMIYTSGSTGRPKGAMNSHRAIRNRLLWMQEAYGLTPEDRVLQKTPFSFDVSVWELFWPLVTGARLVVAAPGGHQDPAYLAETIAREGITTVHFVPSMLRAFLDAPGLERCVDLRRVICSGEALPADLARRFQEVLPAELHNLYGPTEAAVDVTAWRCDGDDPVPIGRPIANTSIHLLDPALHRVPVGVAGELFIGGVQPARGYHGRPELTAERFVPDLYGAAGARLYRTGDLARWRPDGAIEYLGRIDHQVKIRGQRVELGEVEAALAALPGVREAAVTVWEDTLVAHVAGEGLAEDALRAALRASLPEALVPSAFLFRGALPLTPAGKVDRKALADLRPQRRDRSVYVAPRTWVEARLAAIWSELLGVEQVGVHGHFFELGGHSLLATRVASRLRSDLGAEVPIRALFEAPVLADLAARVESSVTAGVAAGPVLRRRETRGGAPLSFGQERFWFLDRLAPGSAAYNIPVALRLQGDLDVPALAAALGGIVRRHEVLRTTYPMVDGRPVQRIGQISADAGLPLPVVDLRTVPDRARSLLAEAAAQPFDLENGPVLRALLLRLGETDWIVLLNLHHISGDGWSLGVMMRELGALYAGAALPALPLQYADFAAWQREVLDRGLAEEQLAYWKRRLAGAPGQLGLPADRPRPAVQSYRGGSLRERLVLERREDATPFMVLLASFAALLSRHTSQTDIVIGTPVAGRTRSETEGLVGLFLNTLALRVDLSGDPGFRELLDRVRDVTLEAYANQDLPFEKVVEELDPVRDLSRTPIFQAQLVLQNTPAARIALPGLTLTPLEVDVAATKFDLSLSAAESGDALEVAWGYNRDLFDATRIARMRGHFAMIAGALAADPGLRISELPLLTEAERHQLLEWNATSNDWPAGPGLTEMIGEQARRTPDAVAVSFEGEDLSYAELWERAGRVAAWLGNRPDELVGISMERSLELVVGLVGILRSGAAYVPIDPGYPADRVAYMIADSGVSVILDRQGTSTTAATARAQGSLSSLSSLQSFGSFAAYMIYTSGSTGRPKGAVNSHRAIRNRLLWMQEAYGLTPEDRVLQKTPFSFDVSVWEFFWPLIVGARLVVAVPGGHQDPAYLAETIAREGITTVHFVPSMLRAFLDAPGLERCVDLRRVICSGEALPADLARRFREVLPAELHNLYGPTEAAVDVTAWHCGDEDPVPIGRPIANTSIHLLDPALRPVPVGVAGGLFIGGVQPARGYHGRPELTAERFIPDLYGEAGARLYRTGDLARWRPDGAVEYLGRIDHQVKVRGVRIELGEVEAALAALPGVRESVVTVREDALVAHLVGESLSEDALRAALRRSLPEALVPSAFLFREALPLTPAGKVDRKALADLRPARQDRSAYVAPRTPVEARLAAIWSDLLGVGKVGAHSHFFELGGHSLMATRVASRLRSELGVEVS